MHNSRSNHEEICKVYHASRGKCRGACELRIPRIPSTVERVCMEGCLPLGRTVWKGKWGAMIPCQDNLLKIAR